MDYITAFNNELPTILSTLQGPNTTHDSTPTNQGPAGGLSEATTIAISVVIGSLALITSIVPWVFKPKGVILSQHK